MVPVLSLGWGVQEQLSHRLSPLQEELRPRLCCMKKGPDGYGFNLHSDKSRPGQYVRAVDPDSPAEAAGLAPHDRIIEVCRGRGGVPEKLGSPSYPGAQEGGALCQEGARCPRCWQCLTAQLPDLCQPAGPHPRAQPGGRWEEAPQRAGAER